MVKGMSNSTVESSGKPANVEEATQALIAELESMILLLESDIPANPVAPKNEERQDRLGRALSEYFDNLGSAIDMGKVEQLYYKHVEQPAITNEGFREEFASDAQRKAVMASLNDADVSIGKTGYRSKSGKNVGGNYEIKDSQGKVVGHASALFTHSDREGDFTGVIPANTMMIDSIEIDEEMRGKGIGSKVLDHIEADARSAGVKRAWATSVMDNAEAFWQRNGYSRSAKGRIWVKSLTKGADVKLPLSSEQTASHREAFASDEQRRAFFAQLADEQPSSEGRSKRSTESKERARRAKESYNPATKAKQARATKLEGDIAEAVNGETTPDNQPFDVLVGDHAIECKLVAVGSKAEKITMHKDALARKLKTASENRLTAHTVVYDERISQLYYRSGVGSFRFDNMTPVSVAGLGELLK